MSSTTIEAIKYTDISGSWLNQSATDSGRLDVIEKLETYLCLPYEFPDVWTKQTGEDGKLTAYSVITKNSAIPLECIEKTSPSSGKANTWSYLTDSPNMATGRTFVGKAESWKAGTLKIPHYTSLQGLFEALKNCGVRVAFAFILNDKAYNPNFVFEQWIPDCQITDVNVEGGGINGSGSINIEYQPLGGEFYDFGWKKIARASYKNIFADGRGASALSLD